MRSTSNTPGGAVTASGSLTPDSPVATTPTQLAPALAALLGSEDTLFRDPFADFIPSGR